MSKIALVTGANRELGLEVTRQTAQSGATVILAGRDATKAEDAGAQLRANGLDVSATQLDVTDPDSARRVADGLRARRRR